MNHNTHTLQAHVLVVDDNEDNRDMLARRLTRQGHLVSVASDGQQALQLMHEQRFDLVLLDIMMPGMNGYQVLEAMRTEPALQHLPVVVVSAVDDVDSVVRCIELGAEDYLFKPINAVLLRARVNASLEKKRLRDQEQAYLAAIQREMDLARHIQASFLPEQLPHPPGWQIAAMFQPASQVAGDFYDVFPLPGQRLGLLIGDVCGKGVGAALFMALTRSLLRAFAEQHTRSPEDTLSAVTLANDYMVRHHQPQATMFATLFFGVLELDTGQLHYINAGHFPPIVVSHRGEITLLNPSGPLVGVTLDFPFNIEVIQLQIGDWLLAYTDGVTETPNSQGELFGQARLLEVLAVPKPSVAACLEHIAVRLVEFSDGIPPVDDMTMLAVCRKG